MKSRNDKINAAHTAAKLSDAALVEQQRIKRALGPNQWNALLRYVGAQCESINKNTPKRLILETISDYAVKLKDSRTGVFLSLQYEDDVPCVWLTSTDGNTRYFCFTVIIDDAGTRIQVFDQKRKMAMPVDELGDQLIDQILNANGIESC